MVIVAAFFGGQAVPVAAKIQREVVQTVGLIDLRTFLLYHEIFFQSLEELLFAQAVQVFYYAIVVYDIELVIREANGEEVVVFFFTRMVGVLLLAFIAYEGGSGTAVVTVSNVHCRNLCYQFGNTLNVFVIIDHPELMSEAVYLCHEIVFRSLGSVFGNDLV